MKLLVTFLVALGLNLAMFMLMDNMVSTDVGRVVDVVDVQNIEFLRTAMDEETRTRDRRTPAPPKPREIQRPQAQVTDIAERATALENFTPAFEIAGLLGQGSGVDIGQTLIGGGGADQLNIQMANDLVPISMLPPQYPPSARVRNIEGWVDVLFRVSARGNVEEAWVVDAMPADVFDQAAIDAALRWRFRPVTEAGQAVSAERMIRINFNLEDMGR